MTAFATLLDGYSRFRAGPYEEQRRRFDRLAAEGQSPPVMIIACSDSRVDPARIFDVAPGEVFVLRNVATWCHRTNPMAASTVPARRSNSR